MNPSFPFSLTFGPESFPFPSHQQWFSVREIAKLIGKSSQYIRNCIQKGQILAHVGISRGRGQRCVYQVSRNSLQLYLAETSNHPREAFLDRLKKLIAQLPLLHRYELLQGFQGTGS